MSSFSRSPHTRAPLLPDYIPLISTSTASSSSTRSPHHPHRRRLAVLLAAAALVILWASLHRTVHLESGPAYSTDGTLLDSARRPGSFDLAPDPAEQLVVVYNSTSRHSPYRPRRPCNALTASLVALSPNSSAQRFLSPSPPLPPNTPLSTRLDDWLSSPLAPPELWTQFGRQTCGNPSVRRNANRLHVRDSEATWAQMDVERVRGIREELSGVLRRAEEEGRLSRWASEDSSGTRGIVWTAGNADTFDRVLTSLRLLRHSYNCTLAAHVVHFPSESPSPEQVAEFAILNSTVSSLDSVSKDEQGGRAKSFHLKGAALVQAPFDEVLLLDSDNIPVRDVASLFDSPEYLEMGAVLWPDFFKDQPENGIWAILGVQCRDEWSTESGQVLIRKSRHLDVLPLVEHMLLDWPFWFRFSDGDKDLFRYAFLALRKRWAVPARHLSSASWTDPGMLGSQNRERFAGHSMVQYGMASEVDGAGDVGGRVMFVHANLLKRVLGKLHDGNTWGRTLRLRLPRRSPPSPDSPAHEPLSAPFLLTGDALANVSPLTGLGIPISIPSSSSSSSRPVPRSVRSRAALERGLWMRFWSGHIGRGAYVLAVDSAWEDELALGAAWGEGEGDRGVGEGEGAEARYREGEEEQDEWAQWVERERVAQCGDGDDGALALHDELLGADGAAEAAATAGMMEVVSWADDPDLREFEARYYGVGRGKAGGTGFR
ncbi:glycosyltransferase family 71 protein, partial [Rhodotorula graminis WP1]